MNFQSKKTLEFLVKAGKECQSADEVKKALSDGRFRRKIEQVLKEFNTENGTQITMDLLQQLSNEGPGRTPALPDETTPHDVGNIVDYLLANIQVKVGDAQPFPLGSDPGNLIVLAGKAEVSPGTHASVVLQQSAHDLRNRILKRLQPLVFSAAADSLESASMEPLFWLNVLKHGTPEGVHREMLLMRLKTDQYDVIRAILKELRNGNSEGADKEYWEVELGFRGLASKLPSYIASENDILLKFLQKAFELAKSMPLDLDKELLFIEQEFKQKGTAWLHHPLNVLGMFADRLLSKNARRDLFLQEMRSVADLQAAKSRISEIANVSLPVIERLAEGEGKISTWQAFFQYLQERHEVVLEATQAKEE